MVAGSPPYKEEATSVMHMLSKTVPDRTDQARSSSPGAGGLNPALTLQLLDTQERRAVGRRDWSVANRVLTQRLRLKAQLLAPQATAPGMRR